MSDQERPASAWKQHAVRAVLGAYLRLVHRLEYHPAPDMPKAGPFIVLTSHFSILDTVVLMVTDPFRPFATLVVKDEAMKAPVMGTILRWWGAIGVQRDGTDSLAVREMLRRLERGQGVCIAPEGTRGRDGHLGPINSVLARMVVSLACRGIPVFPVAEVGTYESMPPGAVLPRPHKIDVNAGNTMDFSRWCGKKLTESDVAEAASYIRASIAALLPPERQPLPGSPDTYGTPLVAGRR